MSKPHYGTCPICSTANTPLVEHHWYDDSTHYIGHIRLVCGRCNSKLSTGSKGKDNHILPAWEEQVDRLRKGMGFEIKHTRTERTNKPTVTRTIRLPLELETRLKWLCAKRLCSINAWIVNTLKRESKPKKPS